jgi:putative Mg2+ transporter-C (MgtC) family protein
MLSNYELISRLVMAAVLGGLIGFERERLHWAAGLRTHMLVSVGACLVMIVSAFGFADVANDPHVSLDPSRVAAQVVSGIGFLGAGSILLRGEVIRGLTTAASLWAVAAVGLAVGGGLYVGSIAATVIMLFILAGMKPIENRYFEAKQHRELSVSATHGTISLESLNKALGAAGGRVRQFGIQPNSKKPNIDDILITFSRVSQREFDGICEALKQFPGVKLVTEVKDTETA